MSTGPDWSASSGGGGLGGGGGGAAAESSSQSQQQPSATTLALRQQDEMIDELSTGVGRLHDQSRLINDEANLHVRLIDDMDSDVDRAHSEIEAETRRAQKLREDRSVCRLYLIIGVLAVLLFLLIILGLS